ncbi:GNAT family N-acetyltransferase [Candidatus Parcubacteria bacterium]|nr:GNAT family N-acetyltransferase [Candidatus Parcubacteria bacterium]
MHRLLTRAVQTSFNYFPADYQRQVIRGNSPLRLFRSLLQPSRKVLVATSGGNIIGYAIGSVPRNGNGQLYWLYVKPDFRGQKAGAGLLSRMLELQRTQGAHEVIVVTHDYRQYYERRGFSYLRSTKIKGVDMDLLSYHLQPETVRSSGKSALWPRTVLWLLLLVTLGTGSYFAWDSSQASQPRSASPAAAPPPPAPPDERGRILAQEEPRTFTPGEATAIARQNYGPGAPPVATAVTKVVFRYRSQDTNGQPLAIYARAYLPAAPAKTPVLAFGPGTTGLTDRCAASLEQPQLANWANYESHLLMYAGQGYAVVMTDYEGMRDETRLHHYMIGELEGRAVLDSVRALRRLPLAKTRLDNANVFTAGYSQGGHAAFWADKISPRYAPEIPIKGAVGFGPVMSVKQTLADLARGATIQWFGPLVLASYSDYYPDVFGVERILQPPFAASLAADIRARCVDSFSRHWGTDPAKVYQPQFVQALRGNTLGQSFPALAAALDKNTAGDATTKSAKLINQGALDNVILPAQQTAILPLMCSRSRGPVMLREYPNVTHYDTMVKSFNDTVAWMRGLANGQKPPSSCSR